MPAKLTSKSSANTVPAVEATMTYFRFSAPSQLPKHTLFMQPANVLLYEKKNLTFSKSDVPSISVIAFSPYEKLKDDAVLSSARFFRIEFSD